MRKQDKKTMGIILLVCGIILLTAAILLAFWKGGGLVPMLTLSSILVNTAAVMLLRSAR